MITFLCDQGSSEGSHDTGNVGTDCFTVCNLFKASQDCIIVKGSALYNDLFTKLGCIGYLDNLEKGIFDNRVGKSSGDIRYGCAFFLCLFYLGIHKYGTTGTKVDRMFGK